MAHLDDAHERHDHDVDAEHRDERHVVHEHEDEHDGGRGRSVVAVVAGDNDHRRGGRTMAALGAALVLGAVGFAVGRAPHSPTQPRDAAAPVTASAPVTAPAPVTTSAPVAASGPDAETLPPNSTPPTRPLAVGSVVCPAPVTVGGSDPALPMPTIASGQPFPALPGSGGGGGGYGPYGGYGFDGPEGPAGTLLGSRTTAQSLVLTGYLQNDPANAHDGSVDAFPGWRPQPWCSPVGGVRISVVGPDIVGLGGTAWFATLRDTAEIGLFGAGFVEGHPVFVAGVQVDASVSSVALSLPDGSSDSATPASGLAMLAVYGQSVGDFTVTLTRTDGTSTTITPHTLRDRQRSAQWRNGCQPPPPSLPAGGPQPQDPGAADAAVRAAFSMRNAIGAADLPDVGTFVDDPTGIVAATEEILAGPLSDSARSAVGTITGLVFTSPTEAWFR